MIKYDNFRIESLEVCNCTICINRLVYGWRAIKRKKNNLKKNKSENHSCICILSHHSILRLNENVFLKITI